MLFLRYFRILTFLFLMVNISGCRFMVNPTLTPYLSVEPFTETPVPSIPMRPTNTPFPTFTPTSSVTPTSVWILQSGEITCPILLYHRIEDAPLPDSLAGRYYISPTDFQWQMQALKDWGYSTIPMSLLVTAINTGTLLPPRPVVVTFDDGYESVYENAFPVMQSLGLTGVIYLVGNYIGSPGYMDISQIRVMTGGGWDIGSHSMTHPHLPADNDKVYFEGGQSKSFLAAEIGTNVQTFAYPYGETDSFIVQKIAEYGYIGAVGLGSQYVHNHGSLFYLSRIEIRNGIDLVTFGSLLPWSTYP
jgi:peptidoglycan/xylan/chitin deacetylase (PgdA/CDA1 family)